MGQRNEMLCNDCLITEGSSEQQLEMQHKRQCDTYQPEMYEKPLARWHFNKTCKWDANNIVHIHPHVTESCCQC